MCACAAKSSKFDFENLKIHGSYTPMCGTEIKKRMKLLLLDLRSLLELCPKNVIVDPLCNLGVPSNKSPLGLSIGQFVSLSVDLSFYKYLEMTYWTPDLSAGSYKIAPVIS